MKMNKIKILILLIFIVSITFCSSKSNGKIFLYININH